MTAEAKLRTLAYADPTLRGLLCPASPISSNTFRWFSPDLPQGYIVKGSCVRVFRVSTSSNYEQRGPNPTEWIRFQVDCMDTNDETARALAAAVSTWFSTISIWATNQFDSPVTLPANCPNFQLNVREDFITQTQPPTRVYVVTMDWRVYSNVNN